MTDLDPSDPRDDTNHREIPNHETDNPATNLPRVITIVRTLDHGWTDEDTGVYVDPETYTISASTEIDGNAVGTNVTVSTSANDEILAHAYGEALRGMLNFTGQYRDAVAAVAAGAARRGEARADLNLGTVFG